MSTTTETTTIKLIPTLARDLQLRDVVRSTHGPFSDSTVRKLATKDDPFITLFRPYVHCADFEYTGGVITYIGHEDFKIYADDARPYLRYPRPGEKV